MYLASLSEPDHDPMWRIQSRAWPMKSARFEICRNRSLRSRPSARTRASVLMLNDPLKGLTRNSVFGSSPSDRL